MLLQLSEALRLPLPGITPPGLKLTADAGRFEREGSSGPNIFSQVRDGLLPGGIQVRNIQDRLLQTYRREVDFIQRYVFPRGHVALAAGAEIAGGAVRHSRHSRTHFRARLCQDTRQLAK